MPRNGPPVRLPAMVSDAVDAIRKRVGAAPRAGFILGSGFGGFIDSIEDRTVLGFDEIPHFPSLGVAGHKGQLVLGRVGALPVAVASGRKHLYEGEGLLPVLFPTLVFRALGARILILTNAAGGAHADWDIGDAMLITDHIDSTFHAHTAEVPATAAASGFPPAADAPACPYSPRLAGLARDAARDEGIVLREGVYVFSLGPFYETPAEVRALSAVGGDAFGMSTVPEALLASRLGMEVAAFSAITNLATGIADHAHSHGEVMANAGRAIPRITGLIAGLLERIARDDIT